MSMVKESVFNILSLSHGLSFEGINVLDLFCGTGAMGIESVERGAEMALMVDNNVSVAKANVTALLLDSKIETMCCDVLRLPITTTKYNLVFIDPPYDQNSYCTAMRVLKENKYLAEQAIVICLMRYNNLLMKIDECYRLYDVRVYGITKVLFFKYGAKNDKREVDQYIE